MWMYVIDNLSNNDVTKWNQILEMNVIEFLGALQFYRIKEKRLKQWQEEQRNSTTK